MAEAVVGRLQADQGGPETLFTREHKGMWVRIAGNDVEMDHTVLRKKHAWGDATHYNCEGEIKHVEEKWKGKVQLKDERGRVQQFENPASSHYNPPLPRGPKFSHFLEK